MVALVPDPLTGNQLSNAGPDRMLEGFVRLATDIAMGRDPIAVLQRSLSGALIGLGLNEIRKTLAPPSDYDDLLKTPR